MEITIKDNSKEYKAICTDQQMIDLNRLGIDPIAHLIKALTEEVAKSKNEEAKNQMFKDGLGDLFVLTISNSSDLERFIDYFECESIKVILSCNLIGKFSDYLMSIDKYKRIEATSESLDYLESYQNQNLNNTVIDFFVNSSSDSKIVVIPSEGKIFASTLNFV